MTGRKQRGSGLAPLYAAAFALIIARLYPPLLLAVVLPATWWTAGRARKVIR